MKTEVKPQNPLAKQPTDETLMPAFFRENWPVTEWFRPLIPGNGTPWSLLRQMEENAHRFFGPSALSLPAGVPALPRVDVSETDTEWLIEAELPGVRQEDIVVEIRDGVLYLQAHSQQETSDEEPGTDDNRRYYRRERHSSWVERALSLPDGVEEEKATCDYNNGILRCRLPKKPGASSSRRIPVGGG